MRRILVVLGMCLVAAASTALAASGGAARPIHARALPTRFHSWVLPGVGHVVLPSGQAQTCFVSSANQECGLTPCKAFVAASATRVIVVGSADDVPITPSRCGKRAAPSVLVGEPMPLLVGALRHGPRLTVRPR